MSMVYSILIPLGNVFSRNLFVWIISISYYKYTNPQIIIVIL